MNDLKKQPQLSKSKLLSAHQCLKMLHLEWHRPDLAEVSEATEAAYRTGHEVGNVAKQIYGTADSVEVAYRRGDMDAMVRETAELLANGADFPIFEATFRHKGVLVRVDVLIPFVGGWRAVEIKASTKVNPEHHQVKGLKRGAVAHFGATMIVDMPVKVKGSEARVRV